MTRLSTVIAFAICACAGGAMAQQGATVEALGAVKEVKGVVTMSLGSQVATVQPETPVFDGARFVAGSAGSAELRFENGCTLKLNPNQWVTIDGTLDCPRQIAAIQTLPNAGGFGLFAKGYTLPLLGLAALTGVVAKVGESDITPRPR